MLQMKLFLNGISTLYIAFISLSSATWPCQNFYWHRAQSHTYGKLNVVKGFVPVSVLSFISLVIYFYNIHMYMYVYIFSNIFLLVHTYPEGLLSTRSSLGNQRPAANGKHSALRVKGEPMYSTMYSHFKFKKTSHNSSWV